MPVVDKPLDAENLLKSLGAHARAQQSAGTAIGTTSVVDPQAGLPENFRAALATVKVKSRAPAYAAAMKGLGFADNVKAPARKANWLRWLIPSLALPAFAAAAFLLWPSTARMNLPSYQMQAHGVAELRGEMDPQALIVKPGSTLQVVLRPAVAVTVPVQAKLFWLHHNELVPWPVAPEVAETGAMRVRGTFVPSWQTGTGDELVAFVGAAGAFMNLTTADLASPPQGVQVLRQRVTWQK